MIYYDFSEMPKEIYQQIINIYQVFLNSVVTQIQERCCSKYYFAMTYMLVYFNSSDNT